MRKDVLKIAQKKLDELLKKYDGFRTVILDDWRGFRFIYDTEDSCKYKNGCKNCSLYKLLKNEEEGLFSAGLYLASDEDKKLFGSQKYLNCKTLKQYRDCYVNFLVNKTNFLPEILDELKLVRNMKVMYVRDGNEESTEEWFKGSVVDRSIALSSSKKGVIIEESWNYLQDI